ncbi:MAG: DUF177 domain-containing protein [Dehalococcoidia bacterium]
MALQYNVSTLLREPIGATRVYDIDDRALVDEAGPTHQRVVGEATFLRTKDSILVTAHLRGDHSGECSRCLCELALSLAIDIEDEFFATSDAITGAGVPVPEDPDAFRIDAEHILDLEEAVRQYWNLGLPMQPLCRPDCQGLCPRCGSDLNDGACACPPDPDERWSSLRELVKQTEGS